MKFACLLLIVVCISCNDQPPVKPEAAPKPVDVPLSKDQSYLIEQVKWYKVLKDAAGSDVEKNEVRTNFLDTLHSYIVDSLSYQLRDFRVKSELVYYSEMTGINFFVGIFKDKEGNEYSIDFVYKAGDSTYKNDPAYLLLKDLKQGIDTTISFLYTGKIGWDKASEGNVYMQVIPFSDHFNLDSAKRKSKYRNEARQPERTEPTKVRLQS